MLPRNVISNATLVRWLLAHGADPNKKGYRFGLPIAVACSSSTPEVVDLLLANGATRCSYCLHVAADCSVDSDGEFHPQCLIMLSHLLDLGMDINELSDMEFPLGRGHGLFTPLHAAVIFDSAQAINLLLKRGDAIGEGCTARS
jgi:ankyrin repeat protein